MLPHLTSFLAFSSLLASISSIPITTLLTYMQDPYPSIRKVQTTRLIYSVLEMGSRAVGIELYNQIQPFATLNLASGLYFSHSA